MRKWSAHLQYSWWKYLLLVLMTFFVWCGIFSSLAKPAANTQVGVLYLGEKLDAQMLQQELQTTLLRLFGSFLPAPGTPPSVGGALIG